MVKQKRIARFVAMAAGFLAAILFLASRVAVAQPGTDIVAGEDALSEVTIDVNPSDPDNLVIVGHDNGLDTMNTFYSTDGGQTWTAVPIDDADDGYSSVNLRFDPTVAFDANGNVYIGYGVSFGSPAQIAVVVAKSTDGGQTYSQFTQVALTSNIGGLPGNDKWHLATGPDPTNASQENVYIAWTQNVFEIFTDQRIVVSSSTDGGATFSAPLIINDGSISGTDSGNLSADPAVGPGGELYVSWEDISAGNVLLDVSTDGGTTFGTDILVTSSNTGFKTPIPPQPDRGVFVGPTIDTDRSGGANDGRLYLIYTDLGAGGLPDVNIYVRYSDDDGSTWSSPVLVNDDGGTNSQFLPWLDVDQVTGQVTTAWYDARNDADNKQVEIYMAASNDGGDTFETNILVSDAPSNMSDENPDRYAGNFLEYIGIATYDCLAVPVWSDNSQSWTGIDDLDYVVDRVDLVCNHFPVADANGPYTTDAGAPIMLDGTGSSDPDGDTLTYEWDFDDDGNFDDAVGPTPSFGLGIDGVYPIALRVTDPSGESDIDGTTVTVIPVVISVAPSSLDSSQLHNIQVTLPMTISNSGLADLNWTIDEANSPTIAPGGHIEWESSTAMESSVSRSGTTDATPPVAYVSIAPFSEGFEDITNLPGWAMNNNPDVVGETEWFQGAAGIFPAHSGPIDSYIAADYRNTDGSQISNWLMTPEVPLKNGSTLSFWTRAISGSAFPDRLQVRMSQSGPSVDVGTGPADVGDFDTLLLDINENLVTGGYPEDWTQYTVTIIGVPAGRSGRLAFRYYVPLSAGPSGSNSDYIGIDTVEYTEAAGKCDSLSDIPWASASPTSGSTIGGDSSLVDVTFDSTGLGPSVYTGTLCISSNDPVQSLVEVPMTMTVPIGYGVQLSADMAKSGMTGETVSYTVAITNTGNTTDTFDISASSIWTATPFTSSVTLVAFASTTFSVAVDIPAGAADGSSEVATITATSQSDALAADSIDLTTTAAWLRIYLPVLMKN